VIGISRGRKALNFEIFLKITVETFNKLTSFLSLTVLHNGSPTSDNLFTLFKLPWIPFSLLKRSPQYFQPKQCLLLENPLQGIKKQQKKFSTMVKKN
jgi:hypothetical protein